MIQLAPGAEFGDYQVLSLLGEGGMGQVWLVEHRHLRRREALKIISVSAGTGEQFARRFENEARLIAAMEHPSIVTVYSYGISGGSPWFTMSYVPGQDLGEAGALPPAEVAEIIGRTADALDYAHARGVVHRDIKPANIMVARDRSGRIQRVVVLDFGIARLAEEQTGMTGTGAFVGTLANVAPEVIATGEAGPAADQYSLACTAYQLLSGHQPYETTNPAALMNAHLTGRPRSLTEPPGPVDGVLGRALAKSPEQRFPSCRQFATALADVLFPRRAPGPRGPSGPGPVPGPVPTAPGPVTARTVPGPVPVETRSGPLGLADAEPSQPGPTGPAEAKGRRTGVVVASIVAVLLLLGAGSAIAWLKLGGDDAPSQVSNVAGTGNLESEQSAAPEPDIAKVDAMLLTVGDLPTGFVSDGLTTKQSFDNGVGQYRVMTFDPADCRRMLAPDAYDVDQMRRFGAKREASDGRIVFVSSMITTQRANLVDDHRTLFTADCGDVVISMPEYQGTVAYTYIQTTTEIPIDQGDADDAWAARMTLQFTKPAGVPDASRVLGIAAVDGYRIEFALDFSTRNPDVALFKELFAEQIARVAEKS